MNQGPPLQERTLFRELVPRQSTKRSLLLAELTLLFCCLKAEPRMASNNGAVTTRIVWNCIHKATQIYSGPSTMLVLPRELSVATSVRI